jgi:hypothetical protein
VTAVRVSNAATVWRELSGEGTAIGGHSSFGDRWRAPAGQPDQFAARTDASFVAAGGMARRENYLSRYLSGVLRAPPRLAAVQEP